MPPEAESTATETTAETTATETTQTTETTQGNILADAGSIAAETASADTKAEGDKAEGDSSTAKEASEEDKKPEPRAPEEYAEFSVPEGVTFDETSLTEFKALAKEQDLTQEQAQKLLEFGGTKLKAQLEAPYKLWNETQEKWKSDVKADAEIGGTKFEESIKNAALVFTPGESNPFVANADEAKSLREALNFTGAGNNPAIVKMFVKMGKLLAEPGNLTGGPRPPTAEDRLKAMYPTMPD